MSNCFVGVKPWGTMYPCTYTFPKRKKNVETAEDYFRYWKQNKFE